MPKFTLSISNLFLSSFLTKIIQTLYACHLFVIGHTMKVVMSSMIEYVEMLTYYFAVIFLSFPQKQYVTIHTSVELRINRKIEFYSVF